MGYILRGMSHVAADIIVDALSDGEVTFYGGIRYRTYSRIGSQQIANSLQHMNHYSTDVLDRAESADCVTYEML